MFKDRDEALEEISRSLLEEEPEEILEDWEDSGENDPWEDSREDFSFPDEDLNAYNGDDLDEDLDNYSEELSQPPKKDSLVGLSFACIGLMAAILALVLYWVIRIYG